MLSPSPASPLSPSLWSREWVALDLEASGLDPANDRIIEVGAVKYRGAAVVDRFATLVNPRRPISQFIQALTGIQPQELERAPLFETVAEQLRDFIGAAPVIGHNVAFDVGFLGTYGLKPPGPAYDTLDLASVLLPGQESYSLASLCRTLEIAQPEAHRAAADAENAGTLFLRLLDRLFRLQAQTLSELRRIADRSDWSLRHLFRDLIAKEEGAESSEVGLEGLDGARLKERLSRSAAPLEAVATNLPAPPLQELLGPAGPMARSLAHFEARPQQVEMAARVEAALAGKGQLVVEAGTGVGKSLAYLVPSALLALRTGQRVVVSTNTLNLQEQLVTKDLPDAKAILQAAGVAGAPDLRFALLKGRANYLCLRRWSSMKQGAPLSAAEARTVAKLLVWLQTTQSGDRGEINLTPLEAAIWNRLSADHYDGQLGPCSFERRGLCFYQAARKQAESAHIVIANHALLALDASMGNLLPDYKHLVVDEAHNLEAVITQQWGLEVDENALEDALTSIAGGGATAAAGLLGPLAAASRSVLVEGALRDDITRLAQEAQSDSAALRTRAGQLFRRLTDFATKHGDGTGEYGATLRLTRASRAQPEWSQLEAVWEEVNILLEKVNRQLDRMEALANRLDERQLASREQYAVEVGAARQVLRGLQEGLKAGVAQPDDSMIYWVSVNPRSGDARLNAAPLHIGPLLSERLFAQKESVVLTSATLSVAKELTFVKERLGLNSPDELLLGSPFDYPRQVLAYIPGDIPEPNQAGYQPSLEKAIAAAVRAAQGRTMVLFTGWSSLNATRKSLQEALAPDRITVLAQGADGPPRQLVDYFKRTPNTVLLGTGSFWEGVDIAGEALSVLIIARLPFNVPSDPIFAARSERFDDPFSQYGVPQAVLRFKQGFGRLIRRKTDRGVLVLLDRRALYKSYGATFLDSIPRCTRKVGPAANLPNEIARWLGPR